MAEAATIDDIAKAAPRQKKEEPKKVGNLESLVDETLHLGKTAFNIGLAAGIPFSLSNLAPYASRDIGILAGAQVAANATTDIKKGKKYTSSDAVKSSTVGTITALPVYHIFDALNKIPLDSAMGYVGRGAAFGGLAYPAFLGFYQAVDYLVKNMKFKGLGKYLKENYWPTLKKMWARVLPFGLANVFLAPAYLQVPISAALSYAFALFGAPQKNEVPEEQKRDKTPYLSASASAFGRGLRNLFYAPLDLAYAAGSALSNGYERKPALPATAKTPAPAGTPALQQT